MNFLFWKLANPQHFYSGYYGKQWSVMFPPPKIDLGQIVADSKMEGRWYLAGSNKA